MSVSFLLFSQKESLFTLNSTLKMSSECPHFPKITSLLMSKDRPQKGTVQVKEHTHTHIDTHIDTHPHTLLSWLALLLYQSLYQGQNTTAVIVTDHLPMWAAAGTTEGLKGVRVCVCVFVCVSMLESPACWTHIWAHVKTNELTIHFHSVSLMDDPTDDRWLMADQWFQYGLIHCPPPAKVSCSEANLQDDELTKSPGLNKKKTKKKMPTWQW